MAFATADRVREQVSSFAGGTGAATLTTTPVSGFQSFISGWGASGTGIACWSMGAQWEVALCTLNAGGTTITRTETIASSTGSTINFSAGVLDIFGDAQADWVQSRPTEDYLINGNGQIAQIALGSTADDTYSHDQWYAMTQTAALTTSQLTDVADGFPQMIRLTQGQASAQRIGYAQIIEAQRCKKLRSSRVTFGGWLRYSNAAAVRFAILEWTGTADAVTSDVVNDWTNGTFTAGNFFNSTTLTVRAVGTLTPGAATLAEWRISTVLGSSLNNLIVMVWTEATAAQNSTLDILAQLKRGFVVSPYVFRSFDDELHLCKRFYEKSYDYAVAPGTVSSNGGLVVRIAPSTTVANTQKYGSVCFSVPKRAAPTMTIYGYSGGVGVVSNTSGTDLAASSGGTNFVGQTGFSAFNGNGGSLAAPSNEILYHYTAVAQL